MAEGMKGEQEQRELDTGDGTGIKLAQDKTTINNFVNHYYLRKKKFFKENKKRLNNYL